MNDYCRVAEIEVSYHPARCHRPMISDSSDAVHIFRENWEEGKLEFVESVKVMMLNTSLRCMGICTVAVGGGSSCAVDVRNILQSALKADAKSIVLAHNHPSGSTRPSSHDDRLTKQVEEGCKAVGIKFADHVIVTSDDYYSYRELGKI